MPAPVGFGSNAVPPLAINHRPLNDIQGSDAVNGKSKDSPAHQARAAIEAAALGDAAPANLHGKVTSAIARGLDVSNLLVLQSVETTDTEPADADVAPATDGDGAAADTTEAVPDNEDGAAPSDDDAVTEGGDVALTDEEAIIEEPIVASQGDTDIVDILIDSIQDETT